MVYIFLLLYNHMNILDNIPEIWQRRGVTNSLYDTILSWRMGYMGVLCTQYNFNFFFFGLFTIFPHCIGITFSFQDSVKDFCTLHWQSLVTTGRDFHYKMCSFTIAGMARFYSFKSSSEIAFLTIYHHISLRYQGKFTGKKKQ